MAQSGFTPIALYYSATSGNTPLAANLVNGELAINIADGVLFYKNSGGTVVPLNSTTAVTATNLAGGGALQVPFQSAANTTTFTAAPTTTNQVLTYNGTTLVWSAPSGAGTITTTDFTATAGQTVFTVTYTPGLVSVYRNGIKLGNADYTATNGTSITLATAAVLNDLIEVQAFQSLNLSTAVNSFSAGTTGFTPNTATSGAVTLAGTLNVANGGTGSTTLTANNVLLGNGTSALQAVAPGTSGNVLTSNGTTWVSSAPAGGGVTSIIAGTGISISSGTGAVTITNSAPASTTTGAVGTYGLFLNNVGSVLNPGDTIAGGSLKYSDTTGAASGTNPAGTWQCMGRTGSAEPITVFIRTA